MKIDEGSSVITVFLADLSDFLLDFSKHLHVVCKKFLIEGDADLKLIELIDYLLGIDVSINEDAADANKNGEITIGDVTTIIDMLLGFI